jgi:hypothetical protein
LKKVAKNDNDIFFNSNWIKIVQYYKKYLELFTYLQYWG